ncbi:TetR/AcrR family transcriptional regulator [Variovorax sp. ZS18.2.2]|uniref:TetR/AcrR family transcriptional regulator n=1 Tax=Variovorax sp. ZS18.2.2 TaxID=2971255 RepID=UPI0021509A4E|nr:TetR/AcrR family transcriptional regulator [Variovorax sp. ZS18.2.2]MCR6476103.1 TetR/AcrR family transcriptional regulator [Variovorax sp. ZS18.2.2]
MAPAPDRRIAIMEAALGVFLRYGYRKTSMDDLARAAGISRQGVYLHFTSKDELFKEAVTWFAQRGIAAMRAALAKEDLPIEERLIGAFAALHAQNDGSQMSLEHMSEIVATARELVGPVLEEFDLVVPKELARAIQSAGAAVPWRAAGLTAKSLAQHLFAASHGLKHYAKTPAEYQAGIRIAVRLVCGGPAPAVP